MEVGTLLTRKTTQQLYVVVEVLTGGAYDLYGGYIVVRQVPSGIGEHNKEIYPLAHWEIYFTLGRAPTLQLTLRNSSILENTSLPGLTVVFKKNNERITAEVFDTGIHGSTSALLSTGEARCSPHDEFNEEIGKALAFYRAMIDVQRSFDIF